MSVTDTWYGHGMASFIFILQKAYAHHPYLRHPSPLPLNSTNHVQAKSKDDKIKLRKQKERAIEPTVAHPWYGPRHRHGICIREAEYILMTSRTGLWPLHFTDGYTQEAGCVLMTFAGGVQTRWLRPVQGVNKKASPPGRRSRPLLVRPRSVEFSSVQHICLQ